MEFNERFNTVHEDFFGNIVETAVKTIKNTVKIKSGNDFIVDWAIPTPRP